MKGERHLLPLPNMNYFLVTRPTKIHKGSPLWLLSGVHPDRFSGLHSFQICETMPQGSPAGTGTFSKSFKMYPWVGWWGAHVYQLYTVNWTESTACSKRSPIVLDTIGGFTNHLKTPVTHFEFIVLIPCLRASCETLQSFGHKLPPSHCWLDFGVEEVFLVGLELTISLTQLLVSTYLSQPDSSLAFKNDFFPERKCIS